MAQLTRMRGPKKGRSYPIAALGAGVDWLTCTASRSGSSGQLWAIGERILTADAHIGDYSAHWQMKGYKGWSNAHCRLGARSGDVLLAISGQKSFEKWRQCIAAAENCSRLDLAVDIDMKYPVPAVARHVYADTGHMPSRNGRPSQRRLVISSDGGSTAYIGSRVSERFGRCYDKGVEQQTHIPGMWWRWELECKGETAWNVAKAIAGADAEQLAIGSTVAHWFRAKCGWQIPLDGPSALNKWEPQTTTVDQKLQWLSRQVRPTVQTLLEHCEPARILLALGLPQSAVAEPSEIS